MTAARSPAAVELPDEAWALALSLLPGCGQHRLGATLRCFDGDAAAAWRTLREGTGRSDDTATLAHALGRGGEGIVRRWRAAAGVVDPSVAWSSLMETGTGLWLHGAEDYPAALVDDPDPPPILFWRGDPQALGRPSVAIVGTRRCTAYGIDVARALGRDLAAAGVSVVSGLALGIDGAAHEGALAAGHVEGRPAPAVLGAPVDATELEMGPEPPDAAPPIAVVGSGLDVVYPPRHRALWQRVADHGLLLTEAPPGAAPEPWRFPRRNRILAALVKVVVVVESPASGGSLSTVRNAVDRGITVMAVPGSVRSPASVGTNRLLADGVAPVTCADDVLTALTLEGVLLDARPRGTPAVDHAEPATESPVLAAVEWTPTATEDILRRTGLSLGAAATELARLEQAGLVRRGRGGWWERR